MQRRAVQGTCQLLFARPDGETILLDLIALENLTVEAETMPSGTPFALAIRSRPRTWFTENLIDALAEAALQGAIVDLEITDDGHNATAIMRMDDTELVLDVDLGVHG